MVTFGTAAAEDIERLRKLLSYLSDQLCALDDELDEIETANTAGKRAIQARVLDMRLELFVGADRP